MFVKSLETMNLEMGQNFNRIIPFTRVYYYPKIRHSFFSEKVLKKGSRYLRKKSLKKPNLMQKLYL